MNMIEKVARAICKEEYGLEDGWENQIPAAKAALKAMRMKTPTEILALEGFTDEALKAWNEAIDKAVDQ